MHKNENNIRSLFRRLLTQRGKMTRVMPGSRWEDDRKMDHKKQDLMTNGFS
jgi:hypothetical protein